MARGDAFYFNQYWPDVGDKLHNNSTDVFKLGIIDNTLIPVISTANPRWGAAGGTDLSVNEVLTTGTYPADGVSLSTVITDNWTTTGTVSTQVFDNVSIAADPLNGTNAFWGIIYNDTNVLKQCIAFVDLGGPVDMTAGLFAINWNVAGFATLA